MIAFEPLVLMLGTNLGTAGSWMYEHLVPLGSSPNGYIILQPGQYSSPNTFFLSYRIATGCDTNLDTQYLNKVKIEN